MKHNGNNTGSGVQEDKGKWCRVQGTSVGKEADATAGVRVNEDI